MPVRVRVAHAHVAYRSLSDPSAELVAMRTLFDGEFSVAYGQICVDSRTDPDAGPEGGLHECFMGQRAGLRGAGLP